MSEISTLFNALLSGFVGVIFEWPGTLANIPAGFLPLDGRAISRTTYSALFALWGTTYGAGDLSTTFNVPDDRGYVIGGMDNMGTPAGSANIITAAAADTQGGTSGTETHTLTAAQLPVVNLSALQRSGSGTAGTDNFVVTNLWQGVSTLNLTFGSGQSHPNVQPTRFRLKIVWTGV
jgi:microcystin-dependent protein